MLKTERNVKPLSVLGDGNCYFRSLIATAPDIFGNFDHLNLRTILGVFLAENRNTTIQHDETDAFTFESLFDKNKDGADSYDKRVDQLKQSGEYADILMIYATTKQFQVHIEILEMSSNPPRFEIVKSIDGSERKIILVRQSAPEHYWGTTEIAGVKAKKSKPKAVHRSESSSSDRSNSPTIHMRQSVQREQAGSGGLRYSKGSVEIAYDTK